MYELFIWNIFCVILEGFNILAAVGIRTLVDLVMTKKIGDVGDFPVKLREFKNKGFIAEQQVQFLNNTIDAGSASTHRAYRPSDTDLNILLDVAENLITRCSFFLSAQPKQRSRFLHGQTGKYDCRRNIFMKETFFVFFFYTFMFP